MKYDDASWHYGGDFPRELPPEAGATHIGMFVAWAMLNGLASDEALDDYDEDIEALRKRTITPGQWVMRVLDEKFSDHDLSDEGNAFAASYYQAPEHLEPQYLQDDAIASGQPISVYFVVDSWANYDRIAPLLTARYREWKSSVQ